MKLFKRIAVAVATCALALAAVVPAYANDSTINTDQDTSLTIHKLLKDDSFSSSRKDDGTQKEVTGNPVANVVFKAYPITISAGKSAPAPEFTYDVAGNKITSNGVDYTLGTGVEMKTNGDGIATKTLAQGYYLVVESDVSNATVAGKKVSITETCAPFIVRLPMTNPDGNGWNYDVHVYPKNSTSTATKTPSKTSVNVGESVSWDIKTAVPSGIESFQKFDVTDKLDSALTYTNDSVVVKADSEDGALATFPAVNAEGDPTYTVTMGGDNTLTVSFTAEGRKALAGQKAKNVQVTFDTTVNANVLDGTHANVVKNTATVTFTNQDGTSTDVPTPEVEVHTGAIEITKKDSTNADKKLAGVEFKIASSEANAKAGKYLKKGADGKILDVNDQGYDAATEYVATTDDAGKATFAGLKDYDEADGAKTYRSYWVVETKAASGYELLDAPVQVTFDAQNSTAATHYTISKDILNTPKTNLPLTGGMGTVMFSIAGIVLVGGAVVLLAAKNRKSAHNA